MVLENEQQMQRRKNSMISLFSVIVNRTFFFSLFHLIHRRGEKSKFFFFSMSLQTPYILVSFQQCHSNIHQVFPTQHTHHSGSRPGEVPTASLSFRPNSCQAMWHTHVLQQCLYACSSCPLCPASLLTGEAAG